MAYSAPPSAKVGGHVPRVPHQIAPMISIIGNFIVDQGRLETNVLQLFAHPENSEWFSVILLWFLRSTLLLNRNKHIG